MGSGMCKELWPRAGKGSVGPPRPTTFPATKTTLQGIAVARNNNKQAIHNFPQIAPEPTVLKINNHTASAATPPEASPPPSPTPPQRPPRRRRPQRKAAPPALPPPPRVHSALSLPLAGIPLPLPEGSPQRKHEIHRYLRRCHSYGAVPALIEEMVARLPSPSSTSTSAASSPALPPKRLPPASSATPPPSPSSTPPHSPRRAPRFFIGARSASSSSNAQDTPESPGGLYLRSLSPTGPDAPWGQVLGRREAEHHYRVGLRRAKSQGAVGGGKARNRGQTVAPLTEHVIEMMPTAPSGPPVLARALSSPAIREGEPGTGEAKERARSLVDGLPVSGGEEELKAALERGLRVNRAVSVDDGSRPREEEDSDWLEDTPSLGELEDALAHMLEEEEWVLELERKAVEMRGGEGDGASPVRGEDEQETMKRVNTFMALSALSRGDE
ncbi:YLP motif-containing protein 1-like [Ischnura elegans]|uniref:YLP motif-containing protein 1-like n=1 Tax=Ischnura elegans TaxID=197161 RepID=UPI001ED8B0FA|nr:YLP motif-containing protein 1-like [Ischnura elegans]